MIYKLWMFVCAAYMNDFYRDFRVDTSRHGSVPETTRQKVNIWGLLDGQFLRARPHDQQPFWGWFTPAISGYFWFVGRFMMVYGNASHPVAPAAGHLPGIRALPPSAVISRPARRPKVTKLPVGLTSGKSSCLSVLISMAWAKVTTSA